VIERNEEKYPRVSMSLGELRKTDLLHDISIMLLEVFRAN